MGIYKAHLSTVVSKEPTPAWGNGSIVYKIPGEATEPVAAADSQGRGHFDRAK
jgi:hypothetical protein